MIYNNLININNDILSHGLNIYPNNINNMNHDMLNNNLNSNNVNTMNMMNTNVQMKNNLINSNPDLLAYATNMATDNMNVHN
jgi:hypothetical protein